MKNRYRLYRRNGTFYSWDNVTSKRESLETKDRKQAQALLQTKNEAHQQPAFSLQKARIYLLESNPSLVKRTWKNVMDEITRTKEGTTKERYERAFADTALDLIRNGTLLETKAEELFNVLAAGTVATNVFLRRLHNFALDMNWLPCSIIPKKQWPAVRYQDKRAITFEEHRNIIRRETNAERQAFYELCWHLGGSQSDIVNLQAEDIDWTDRTLGYSRKKTRSSALIHFGKEAASILRELPEEGPLFRAFRKLGAGHRATEFARICARAGVSGVTLHSYRYAWAERAKTAGYPERFAQQALGHNSKAMHRAYAKKAQVKLPSLEEYENKIVALPKAKAG